MKMTDNELTIIANNIEKALRMIGYNTTIKAENVNERGEDKVYISSTNIAMTPPLFNKLNIECYATPMKMEETDKIYILFRLDAIWESFNGGSHGCTIGEMEMNFDRRESTTENYIYVTCSDLKMRFSEVNHNHYTFEK